MPLSTPEGVALSRLRAAGDPTWRDKVRAAMVIHGSVADAAVNLGLNPATLHRWIQQDRSLIAGIKLPNPGWPAGVPRSKKRT